MKANTQNNTNNHLQLAGSFWTTKNKIPIARNYFVEKNVKMLIVGGKPIRSLIKYSNLIIENLLRTGLTNFHQFWLFCCRVWIFCMLLSFQVDRDLFISGHYLFLRSKFDFIEVFVIYAVLKMYIPVCEKKQLIIIELFWGFEHLRTLCTV